MNPTSATTEKTTRAVEHCLTVNHCGKPVKTVNIDETPYVSNDNPFSETLYVSQ